MEFELVHLFSEVVVLQRLGKLFQSSFMPTTIQPFSAHLSQERIAEHSAFRFRSIRVVMPSTIAIPAFGE